MELEEAVPMLITEYDFEKELFIEGEVFGEIKRYSVDHDATIIEEDGTEVGLLLLMFNINQQGSSIRC